MNKFELVNVIERVIDKRTSRGASDISIINWLNHLKSVWIGNDKMFDDFIDAIKQTPLKGV